MSATQFVRAAALASLVVGAAACSRPERSPSVIADLGGDFELSAAGGKRVSLHEFRGRPVLLFFGYTHCPDVCPTTLLTLKQATQKLKGRVQVIMISVDPERDSPDDLGKYLSYFDPHFIGLSGTAGEIDMVAREYRVFRRKIENAGGGYSVSHGAYVYLLDGNGKVRALFGAEVGQTEIVEGVRQLL